MAESHLVSILEETKRLGEVVKRHSRNEKVQGGKRGEGASSKMLTCLTLNVVLKGQCGTRKQFNKKDGLLVGMVKKQQNISII